MKAKKRVILCTYASIYSSKVLEKLIVDDAIEVVAIINSTRVLRPSLNFVQGALAQLKISGLRYTSYLFMTTDFFNIVQRLLFFKANRLKSVHALAKLHDIPIVDTRDINSKKDSQFISNKHADFLLCAHFNQLLKEPILSMDNVKCVNIHPSLLPHYKGADPVFFAMKDGSEKIGVSLHEMNTDFDCGQVLLQSSIKAGKVKLLLLNNCLLFEEGVRLALKFMKNNESLGAVIGNEQIDKQLSYDSWPNSVDVKEFKKSGNKLITLVGLWSQL